MFNKLTNKQLFSKFLVTRFDIYVDLKHTGRPKKVTIRMLLKPKVLIKIECCRAKFSHGRDISFLVLSSIFLYRRDIVVHVSLVSLVVAVGVHHKSLSNDDLLHQLSPFVLFKVTCRLSML